MAMSKASDTAFPHPVLLLLLLLLASASSCSAVVYNVGDRSGWTLPGVNYDSWAASKVFSPNDILRFTYNPAIHNVVQVTKTDYDGCSSAHPLATYTTGKTLVRLPKSGTYYFICGAAGHCANGMKAEVTVH